MALRFGTAVAGILRSVAGKLAPDPVRMRRFGLPPLGGRFAGQRVDAETSLTVGAVYRCVALLSDTMAALPLNVYERAGSGVGDDLVEVPDHALAKLLAKPNGMQTGYAFRQQMAWDCELFGNAYAAILRDPATAKPAALLPFPASSVTPMLSATWQTYYELRSLVTGQAMTLPAADVLHFKHRTANGFIGVSPLAYARQEVGGAIAQNQHGAKTFENGAKPSGVLETEGELTDDDVERLRRMWTENYAGGDNAGKTPVLEGGLKYRQIGLSNQDAQWLESRKFSAIEIARFFGVPPHMIGALERATYGNAEQLGLEFAAYTVAPKSTAVEQEYSAKLVGTADAARGLQFAHDIDGLLRTDQKSFAEVASKHIQMGVWSPNDVRRKLRMAPREGGDVYLQPVNLAPSNGKPAADEPAEVKP